MSETMLDRNVLREIESRGIDPETVISQIGMFERGLPLMELQRPCTLGDGIVSIGNEAETYASYYETESLNKRVIKFVPASGAASRMFRELLAAAARGLDGRGQIENAAKSGDGNARSVLRFVDELGKFAFHDDLESALQKNGFSLKKLLEQGEYAEIVEHTLYSKGLNYSNLPKGIIKFHKYPLYSRTAFEEHIVEAFTYAKDGTGRARVHFTLSPEHVEIVSGYIDSMKEMYGGCSESLEVSYSVQKPSTETIAVDMENRPLLDDSGKAVFRPAGHGALIENLNELDCDMAFIKNIDNVVPDGLKGETYIWKKAIGGYLIKLESLVFSALVKLAGGAPPESVSHELGTLGEMGLNIEVPGGIGKPSGTEGASSLISALRRPLRVCGVVRNEYEPGGGPFWVRDREGAVSKQIVESAQVDMDDTGQKSVWLASTHFNPVDVVCSLRDVRGEAYQLREFVDPEAGFISVKSLNGRDVKALELPGLWNGAMARWNTVFVEVPLVTFNPVKTVFDLLRPEHQPKH